MSYYFSYLQAEKFGDSFVLEARISEEVKKDISQVVSAFGFRVKGL